MKCRICSSLNLEKVLDLGEQPWCNNFLELSELGHEPYYPLRLVYCVDCHASQLDETVPKEVMFGNHTYLSGITNSLAEHFQKIAEEVDDRFFKEKIKKSVLDIGSNDGTQLKYFQKLGYEVLGVESSVKTASIANAAGVPTLNKFFNEETILLVNKKFDVINASGVFFHLEELHSVCQGIKKGLGENGVFVVQFLYMKSIMENMAFDQIYHEHLLYYTLETIETLLNLHELTMFDAYLAPIHGGSIMGFISHKGVRQITERLEIMRKHEVESKCNEIDAYKNFSDRIRLMREINLDFLYEAKRNGKIIYGFGAPVKGNTLLNYFNIGPEIITYLVEKNPLRRDLYSPGMHIPILMEEDVVELPDIYYVLAWNFKDEILKSNKSLIENGIKFYFPVNPGSFS
jgi:SAM-dependent methyltransferase